MRNTTPDLPFEERDTSRLVEDLCLALRDVGVGDYRLPANENAVAAIGNVQKIHAELETREVDFRARMAQLSEETKWQMESLLQECLSFPKVIPYVRESDGVRRAFRCFVCRQREFPDREGLSLCNVCLAQSAISIQNRAPWGGLLLLRIYNESYWCRHASAETVMAAFDDYETLGYTWCAQCVVEEQERRAEIGWSD